MLLVGLQDWRPACKKIEWWDAGMVMCLGEGADLHMVQLMPLPLTISYSSISRLVLPFLCWLTQVVPDKIQEGHKTVMCVMSMSVSLSYHITQKPHGQTSPFLCILPVVVAQSAASMSISGRTLEAYCIG